MTLNPSIGLPTLFWNVKQKINKLQIIHVRWTCLLSLGLTHGFQRVIRCVTSGLIERSSKLLYMKIKQSSLFDLTFLERFVAFRRPLLSGMTDSSRISRGSSIVLFHSSPQPSNATLIASLSLQTTVQTHQTPSSSRLQPCCLQQISSRAYSLWHCITSRQKQVLCDRESRIQFLKYQVVPSLTQ